MNKIFVIYFDLRKYAYIDKNFTLADKIMLLSEMHTIISNSMKKIGGLLYNVQSDTAVYYVSDIESSQIVKTLRVIKLDVDRLFYDLKTPSTLHISCSYGFVDQIELTVGQDKVMNLIGEVMDKLQLVIYLSENPDYKLLNDKICYHELVFSNSDTYNLESIKFNNVKIYYQG